MKNNKLEKLEALAATAMPGLYKVLTFFLIQSIYDIRLLGNISSWQSTSQIIGFLTAIGWSSLILVRIPKLSLKSEKARCFNELTIMGVITLVAFTIPILAVGYILEKTPESVQVVLWLTAWTLYQLPRHHFIALKSYRKALSIDLLVIALSVACLTLGSERNASALLALSMTFGGLISVAMIQSGKDGVPNKISYDIKGIEFGLTNLMGGGISLAMIPLATILGGESLAGAMSLFISITAVSLLIPRSLSLTQLPEISKNTSNKEALLARLSSTRKKILISNIFTSFFGLFVLFYALHRTSEEINQTELATILLLLLIQNTISTQAITDSNILISKECSREVMKINTKTFIAFCASSALIYQFQPDYPVALLALILTIINIFRLYSLKHEASRALREHLSAHTQNHPT